MRDTMPKPRRLLDLDRTVPRSGGVTIHAEFGKPMDITSRRGVGCRPAWQNFASRHVTRPLVPSLVSCRFGRRVLRMGGGNDSWWGWAPLRRSVDDPRPWRTGSDRVISPRSLVPEF